MTVTYRQGKTARNDPYTAFGTMSAEGIANLRALLQERAPDDQLWPHETPYQKTKWYGRVRDALRQVNPDLCLRALRRGAAQAMARAGVPEEILMVQTGHKASSTLHRSYLQNGRIRTAVSTAVREAVINTLMPPPEATSARSSSTSSARRQC